MAIMRSALAQLLIELECNLLGYEDRRIAESKLGRELNRFRASSSDDITRRMRFLIRPGQGIQKTILVKLAEMFSGAVGSPRVAHDVQRVSQLLPRLAGMDRIVVIFLSRSE